MHARLTMMLLNIHLIDQVHVSVTLIEMFFSLVLIYKKKKNICLLAVVLTVL